MEDNIKIELLTPLTGNFTSRELERQWEEGEYEYDVYEGLPLEERRELYRKAPGGMSIQAINGELKELRKKIRLSQKIEKQSLEMEERLRQAKAQEQEVSGKQRREAERNR